MVVQGWFILEIVFSLNRTEERQIYSNVFYLGLVCLFMKYARACLAWPTSILVEK